MLKSAEFKNFTVIPDGIWKFSGGLNLIIGENGLGKSHVLKGIYSTLKGLCYENGGELGDKPVKSDLERNIANELIGSMRPDSLGRMVKRKRGRVRSEVNLGFKDKKLEINYQFSSQSQKAVEITKLPDSFLDKPPVFIPTRELITLCPWFGPLYDSYSIPFEKTWRDTVSLLGAPTLLGARGARATTFLKPLEEAIRGKVVVDANGRFFLDTEGAKVEAPLVAEGMRKFAMLARLISTGVIFEQGYLFWDEPETNLNPKLIKVLASFIVNLASSGIQIFLATHSLFLLREIEIASNKELKQKQKQKQNMNVVEKPRYFALASKAEGEAPSLESGDSLEALQTIVMLDEEIEQADRYFGMEHTH